MGTCLCETCTNPQLKLDALLAAKLLDEKSIVEDVVQDQTTYTALITAVEKSAKENKDKKMKTLTKMTKIIQRFYKLKQ